MKSKIYMKGGLEMGSIVREGRCSLGPCYIEDTGVQYVVHIGNSTYYYSSFAEALRKYHEFCLD